MTHSLVFAMWFLLPAALANSAPIFAASFPGLRHWNAPIDGGRQLRNKPLFGSHKTWRGLLVAIITGAIVFGVQRFLIQHYTVFDSVVEQSAYRDLPIYLGALMGFGAIAGDAVESLLKRQLGRKPGASLLFFDQVDYIIGGVLITLPFIRLTIVEYVSIFSVWFLVHLLVSFGGYKLGLKDEPI